MRRVMRRVEEREEESEGELRRVRLPMSFSSHDNKKIWAVGGDSSVPNTTDPVTTEQEEKIISALIAELQLNHALELDSHPVVNRDLGSRGEAGAASYLVVGRSNAKRLEEDQRDHDWHCFCEQLEGNEEEC